MNKQGFTLIEIIIVIAIMFIMTGFAAPPLYKWRSEAAVKKVAFNIMDGLRRARSQATSEGSTVAVTISPGSHTLTVGTTVIFLSDKINFEAKINIGDAYDDTADIDIDFYPNGGCESTLYVQVNNDPNLCIKIESRALGLSRI